MVVLSIFTVAEAMLLSYVAGIATMIAFDINRYMKKRKNSTNEGK